MAGSAKAAAAAPAVVGLAPVGNPAFSIALRDSGDMFIAEPAGALATDRYLFVADAGTASVLQYDRRGRLLRRLGRRGRGPGEFSAPGPIAVIGDTAVAIADVATAKVIVFGMDAGDYRYTKQLRGSPFSLSISDDTVLAGTFDARQQHSMYRTTLGDSVESAWPSGRSPPTTSSAAAPGSHIRTPWRQWPPAVRSRASSAPGFSIAPTRRV
jgi:hypothetical protein